MSLFVAVFPPDEAVTDLREQVAGLRVGRAARQGVRCRLVTPERWHVTLAFLGDLAPARQPQAGQVVDTAVRDWHADATAPVAVRLAGGDRFGAGGSTVLWVGVVDPTGGLARLAAAVRRELGGAGVPFDPKPFRAHLTLARPGDRLPAADLAADLATLSAYTGPEWRLEKLHLVASHPTATPAYHLLTTHPLPVPG